MAFDFTIRLWQGENTSLADLTDITISGITIIRKGSKFQKPHEVKTNSEKFGYSVSVKGKFFNSGGSNSYPCISFKGEYIDIHIKGFPRYPAFVQDFYAAKGCLKGWGYTNYINKGFPEWLKYRKIEFINN